MFGYKIMAWWGVVVIIVGIGLFGLGMTFELSRLDLERNGEIVKGRITDIVSQPPYRSPVVTFRKKDGRQITFKSQLDVNVQWFHYQIGQEVDVIYHKSTPPSYSYLFYGGKMDQTYMINGFWEKNTGKLTLWLFALIAIVGGYFVKRHFTKKAAKYAEMLGLSK